MVDAADGWHPSISSPNLVEGFLNQDFSGHQDHTTKAAVK